VADLTDQPILADSVSGIRYSDEPTQNNNQCYAAVKFIEVDLDRGGDWLKRHLAQKTRDDEKWPPNSPSVTAKVFDPATTRTSGRLEPYFPTGTLPVGSRILRDLKSAKSALVSRERALRRGDGAYRAGWRR
jgi:hypothetical protein